GDRASGFIEEQATVRDASAAFVRIGIRAGKVEVVVASLHQAARAADGLIQAGGDRSAAEMNADIYRRVLIRLIHEEDDRAVEISRRSVAQLKSQRAVVVRRPAVNASTREGQRSAVGQLDLRHVVADLQ